MKTHRNTAKYFLYRGWTIIVWPDGRLEQGQRTRMGLAPLPRRYRDEADRLGLA